MHGGHLTRDNVRLAHLLCNRRDYGWRMKIHAMLQKRMSLEEIAARLNEQMDGYLRTEGVRFLGHVVLTSRHPSSGRSSYFSAAPPVARIASSRAPVV